MRAVAAFVNVPAVSQISSIKMQFLPSTSPIIFTTSETLALSLLLSIIARSQSTLLAIALALTTPPTSGDTIMAVSYTHLTLPTIYSV